MVNTKIPYESMSCTIWLRYALDLRSVFGDIDIYLFDQLLRGRIAPGARVLDAGCGAGRNLVYLLREGHEVFAADEDPHAVDAVRRLAARLAPRLPASNFRVRRRRHQQRRAAFRTRPRSFRWDARGVVARAGAGRPVLLPSRLVDRDGRSDAAARR